MGRIDQLKDKLDTFWSRLKIVKIVMSDMKYILIVEKKIKPLTPGQREIKVEVIVNNASPEDTKNLCDAVAGAAKEIIEMDSSVDEANRIINNL